MAFNDSEPFIRRAVSSIREFPAVSVQIVVTTPCKREARRSVLSMRVRPGSGYKPIIPIDIVGIA